MENREEKIEALKEVKSYNIKLEKGILSLVAELREDPKDDTMSFLDTIIKGVNWVIEVTNLTMDLLNEGKKRIDKEAVNNNILALNEALKDEDKNTIANLLENDVLSFLKELDVATAEIL